VLEISHHTWLKSIIGKELSEAEARELFMISRRELYRRGDVLFAEGEAPDSIFLVAQGEVDIRKKLADGSPHSLATHHAGAVVGEMSFLTRHIRSASAIIMSSEAVILRVTAKDLNELLAREPAVSSKLMFALASVLAGRLRAVNLRLTELAEANMNHNPHEQIEEFEAFKRKLFSDWSF
jgi:CRP-like cAMP-binding protein